MTILTDRDRQRLQAQSIHVFYEYEQMLAAMVILGTLERLAHLGYAALVAIRNASMESFVVHAANLEEFFRKTGGAVTASQYAYVSHYLPGWNDAAIPWDERRRDTFRNRANSQIRHLGFNRAETIGDAWKWDYNEIAEPISKRVERFRELALPKGVLEARWGAPLLVPPHVVAKNVDVPRFPSTTIQRNSTATSFVHTGGSGLDAVVASFGSEKPKKDGEPSQG